MLAVSYQGLRDIVVAPTAPICCSFDRMYNYPSQPPKSQSTFIVLDDIHDVYTLTSGIREFCCAPAPRRSRHALLKQMHPTRPDEQHTCTCS